MLESRAEEAGAIFRGMPPRGDSDKEIRCIMGLIADTVLCVECIVRKTNIAPLRVEEILVELQHHFRITAISACSWCLRATATYALFRTDGQVSADDESVLFGVAWTPPGPRESRVGWLYTRIVLGLTISGVWRPGDRGTRGTPALNRSSASGNFLGVDGNVMGFSPATGALVALAFCGTWELLPK